jgi:hypothetical protein
LYRTAEKIYCDRILGGSSGVYQVSLKATPAKIGLLPEDCGEYCVDFSSLVLLFTGSVFRRI